MIRYHSRWFWKLYDSGVTLGLVAPHLAPFLRTLWAIWRPLPSSCKLLFLPPSFALHIYWRPPQVFGAPNIFCSSAVTHSDSLLLNLHVTFFSKYFMLMYSRHLVTPLNGASLQCGDCRALDYATVSRQFCHGIAYVWWYHHTSAHYTCQEIWHLRP